MGENGARRLLCAAPPPVVPRVGSYRKLGPVTVTVNGYYGYQPNPAGYLKESIRKRCCMLEKARGVGAAGPLHSRRLGGVLFTANISKDRLAMTP